MAFASTTIRARQQLTDGLVRRVSRDLRILSYTNSVIRVFVGQLTMGPAFCFKNNAQALPEQTNTLEDGDRSDGPRYLPEPWKFPVRLTIENVLRMNSFRRSFNNFNRV